MVVVVTVVLNGAAGQEQSRLWAKRGAVGGGLNDDFLFCIREGGRGGVRSWESAVRGADR